MKIEAETSRLRLIIEPPERLLLNFIPVPESDLMTFRQFRSFLRNWLSVYLPYDASIIEDILDWMLSGFTGNETAPLAASILERIHGGKVSASNANYRLMQMLNHNVRLFRNLYGAILACDASHLLENDDDDSSVNDLAGTKQAA